MVETWIDVINFNNSFPKKWHEDIADYLPEEEINDFLPDDAFEAGDTTLVSLPKFPKIHKKLEENEIIEKK